MGHTRTVASPLTKSAADMSGNHSQLVNNMSVLQTPTASSSVSTPFIAYKRKRHTSAAAHPTNTSVSSVVIKDWAPESNQIRKQVKSKTKKLKRANRRNSVLRKKNNDVPKTFYKLVFCWVHHRVICIKTKPIPCKEIFHIDSLQYTYNYNKNTN